MSGLSWILAFAGFAFLVVAHELGHFTVAKLVGMRVEKFSLFFPPTLASVKRGETEYAIGAIPAGGYVKITGMNPDETLPEEVRDRAYHAQPVWKRIAVILAGPAVNLVLAFVLLFVYFAFVGAPGTDGGVRTVEKGYPAASALKPGDKIVSVDGVRDPNRFSEAIRSHGCAGTPTSGCPAATPARLVVERDGRTRDVNVRPIYDAEQKYTRLGFGFAAGGPDLTLPAGEATSTAVSQFWFITKETVKLPARLFDAQQRKEISGIVGSYEVTRQVILVDFGRVVQILALISLSLAIINLFPFLPLDGGHIFWAIVEKVRGRPIALATMERAGVLGMLLVLGLFALGLTNDIDRLTGEGFQVR